MSDNVQNLQIARGTSLVATVTVKDLSGNVVDLTGATAEYKAARKIGSKAALLIDKTVGDGIEVSDPSGGVIKITFSNADTDSLGGLYYHEAFITDVAGRRARIFTGGLSVVDTL